jgi:hypothetical protein
MPTETATQTPLPEATTTPASVATKIGTLEFADGKVAEPNTPRFVEGRLADVMREMLDANG